MLSQAATFLLETVEFVIVYPALLRFYLQLMRAPARNPISNFVIAITDFAVKPLRKLVPGMNGIDVASLLWAWLAEILLLLLFLSLSGTNIFTAGATALPALMFLAFVRLLQFSVRLLLFVVIVQALISWLSPYHPMRPVFDALTRRFLRPVQRVLPTLGGVDLSPLVIFVVCQLLLMIPLSMLETTAMHMLVRS
ncbi:MAG: YggT family protein [Pseudomonadota bacterium]